jgi:hypothetical protein
VENKRELDVEIHYEVREPPADGAGATEEKGKEKARETIVQMFKVR